MTQSQWQFATRFRRNAFGWKSDTPILRLKEALTELKQAARIDPVRTADGAVLLLEKLSPAISQVDSSSGAMGTAVRRAIDTLVPIIAAAPSTSLVRHRWLQRLWEAVQADDIPYLESLTDFWSELCASPQTASEWADAMLPAVQAAWRPEGPRLGYLKETTICLACLYAAGRYDELLALLDRAPLKWWHDHRWGARALQAQGKVREAIDYAETTQGLNAPLGAIASFCESVLLDAGMVDEAYARYGIAVGQGGTNLAVFRFIRKKYPGIAPDTILRDLAVSQPGQEGKWFAAAKDAGHFELAIDLAHRSPADPRTLTRAARDFAERQPEFALEAAITALAGIAQGYGYDITASDVLDAHAAALRAAAVLALPLDGVRERVRGLLASKSINGAFIASVLRGAL
jgi:tetratricopeptide (TPR) repeat protein